MGISLHRPVSSLFQRTGSACQRWGGAELRSRSRCWRLLRSDLHQPGPCTYFPQFVPPTACVGFRVETHKLSDSRRVMTSRRLRFESAGPQVSTWVPSTVTAPWQGSTGSFGVEHGGVLSSKMFEGQDWKGKISPPESQPFVNCDQRTLNGGLGAWALGFSGPPPASACDLKRVP